MRELVADTIDITTPNPTAQALIPTQPWDRKIWLFAQGPGVFISHAPFQRIGSGYQLPSMVTLQFDIPANSGVWAISGAGTVQVSRMISPVVDNSELVQAIGELVARAGLAPAGAVTVAQPVLQQPAQQPVAPRAQTRPQTPLEKFMSTVPVWRRR